jgi:hypothetical protein
LAIYSQLKLEFLVFEKVFTTESLALQGGEEVRTKSFALQGRREVRDFYNNLKDSSSPIS